MNRNPASVLVDSSGNLVGVSYDGTSYRLKVESTTVSAAGISADVETVGNRNAEAVSYPELLEAVLDIGDKLDKVLLHLTEITGEG